MLSVPVDLKPVLDVYSIFMGILSLGVSLAGFSCVIVKRW